MPHTPNFRQTRQIKATLFLLFDLLNDNANSQLLTKRIVTIVNLRLYGFHHKIKQTLFDFPV